MLDELDDEETAMLFRAIRAYNQLESENEAIRTKAEEDLEAMTASKAVRIAFAPIRKRLEADNKRYAEAVQLNKANGRLGGAPKGNQNARKKSKNTETEETSQNNPNNRAVDFSTGATEGLKKQAKTTENSKFLTEFFSESKRAQVETICMQLHVTPERLRKEAEEVVDEWELTGDTHTNYTEWARHLINHLRIKIRKDNGNSSEQKAGATDTTDRHSGICEPATQKKPRRSTL